MNSQWRTDRATKNVGRTRALLWAVASSVVLAVACDETPTAPSSGAVVTFAVVGETFRVALTTPEQVAAARAAQSGGRAKIPTGRIVPGTQVNTGWSWHLEDVTFAEITIELCDGPRTSSGQESSSAADASAHGARPLSGLTSVPISEAEKSRADTKV